MASDPQSVLVVDDEPTIRMIARTALAGAGYAVTEAGDVVAAVEAVRAAPRPFDAIFLDLSLGGVSGSILIPELRKCSPHSRILLVSGVTEDEAAAVGADGFLGKPFNRASLLAAVRKLLAG